MGAQSVAGIGSWRISRVVRVICPPLLWAQMPRLDLESWISGDLDAAESRAMSELGQEIVVFSIDLSSSIT